MLLMVAKNSDQVIGRAPLGATNEAGKWYQIREVDTQYTRKMICWMAWHYEIWQGPSSAAQAQEGTIACNADDLAQAMLANLDKECGTITRWELFVVVVAFTIIISDRDLLGRLDYGCCWCLDQRHLIEMRSSGCLASKRRQRRNWIHSMASYL